MIQIGKNPIKLAEREGFEPSVPVTQYARLATLRRFANSVTSARLLKTVPTMARWLSSATAIHSYRVSLSPGNLAHPDPTSDHRTQWERH